MITSVGFHPSHRDSVLLFRICTTANCLLLSLYVDDMTIIGDENLGSERLSYFLV